MLGKGKLKIGDYVFVVNPSDSYNSIIIGRIKGIEKEKLQVIGTAIYPRGLVERVQAGGLTGRPAEVLAKPDPNNCIFMLIDRIESSRFNGDIDQKSSFPIWINEKRFFVLDGWIRENLPDIFANFFRASTDSEKEQARRVLLDKMNSLYEKDLKDHMYSVARSSKII